MVIKGLEFFFFYYHKLFNVHYLFFSLFSTVYLLDVCDLNSKCCCFLSIFQLFFFFFSFLMALQSTRPTWWWSHADAFCEPIKRTRCAFTMCDFRIKLPARIILWNHQIFVFFVFQFHLVFFVVYFKCKMKKINTTYLHT